MSYKIQVSEVKTDPTLTVGERPNIETVVYTQIIETFDLPRFIRTVNAPRRGRKAKSA